MPAEAITIGAALLGGLVSFISPCVIVLIPAFLAYLSGTHLGEQSSRWRVLASTLIFTLGFTIVFVLLGASLGWLSESLQNFDLWLERIGGILIVFFGLVILGVIKIPWLQSEHKINLQAKRKNAIWQGVSSFLLGIVFAVGWTPCVSPILAAILVMAGTSGSVTNGAFLLLIYSIGLMIPFIIVGIFLNWFAPRIARHTRTLNIINKIAGVLLIAFGIIVLTGNLPRVMSLLFNL
ncbi:cytochrome c biogenesis CcdA family protein [Patescibacteria group bacterium]